MHILSETPPANDKEKPAAPPEHLHHHFGLALIAIFKLIKGFLLLAAAIGLLTSIHSGLGAMVEHLITFLGMDPDSHHLHWLLEKLGAITPRQLKLASAGSFFYSALLFTEGIGLWFERRWAEYLTVIATSSFVPFELYELGRSVSYPRMAVLVVNLAIVWYLVWTLRRNRKSKA